MDESHLITDLLTAWSRGEKKALERLLSIVERDLRRIAHRYMRQENHQHTLQTSALVNEAYLKLVKQRNVQWHSRAQFFALSAKIMRRILINHARDRVAQKRGGNVPHISLDVADMVPTEKSIELVALDEALINLATFDKLKSQIVEMRYFGGLTIDETAEILEIAPITVAKHWRVAKAWLAKEIRSGKK